MTTRESSRSTAILARLNAILGCHAEKVWTGGPFGRVGAPDITGCYFGHRFELEVKVEGKKARKVQAARLRTWADAGAAVAVVTSADEAEEVVRGIH